MDVFFVSFIISASIWLDVECPVTALAEKCWISFAFTEGSTRKSCFWPLRLSTRASITPSSINLADSARQCSVVIPRTDETVWLVIRLAWNNDNRTDLRWTRWFSGIFNWCSLSSKVITQKSSSINTDAWGSFAGDGCTSNVFFDFLRSRKADMPSLNILLIVVFTESSGISTREAILFILAPSR